MKTNKTAKTTTPNTESEDDGFGWAILELMGHRKLGGRVREQLVAGAPFLRIDVPSRDGKTFATQFYSAGAVYALTPTTEDVARALSRREQPSPVHRFEIAMSEPHRDALSRDEDGEERPF